MESDSKIPAIDRDVAKLKAEQFTATEACYIVTISPERLHEWHRLGLLPEPRAAALRGYRRKYRFSELGRLIMLRILANRGVLLKKAVNLYEGLLVPEIEDAFDALCRAGSIEAAVKTRPGPFGLIALHGGEPGSYGINFKAFWRGCLLDEGTPEDQTTESRPDIESWMVRDAISDVILIQPLAVAQELLFDMEEVLENRGTERLREDIEEHLALFHRPKRKSGGARGGAKKRRKGPKS